MDVREIIMSPSQFPEKSEFKAHTGLLLAIVAIAILSRVSSLVFGLPMNFAPITAIALFSGAYFSNRWAVFLVPLISVFVGDHFVNFLYTSSFNPLYPGWYWQYLSYALIACGGLLLRDRVNPLSVTAASLSSSLLFFLVSNFGVWVSGGLYPLTASGFLSCFLLAIPFFSATMVGDLFYSTLMFGSYEFATRARGKLARQPIRA